MVDFWMLVSDWFMGLGRNYGVDPVIFGSIYVATMPFFWASVAWLVRNARIGASIAGPVCSTSFFMIAAYVYPFAVGTNLPFWMYVAAGICIACCGITTLRTVRKAVRTPNLHTDTSPRNNNAEQTSIVTANNTKLLESRPVNAPSVPAAMSRSSA